VPPEGTSAEFAALIRAPAEKWGKVIRAAGIKPEADYQGIDEILAVSMDDDLVFSAPPLLSPSEASPILQNRDDSLKERP